MLSGLLRILNYVRGATKLSKDLLDVISWLVFAEKVFAICVVNLGNLITKITLNAIFLGKKIMMNKIDKKLCYKRLIFMPKGIWEQVGWSNPSKHLILLKKEDSCMKS